MMSPADLDYLRQNSARMSQDALALALGVSRRTIGRAQRRLSVAPSVAPALPLNRSEIAFIRAHTTTLTQLEIGSHLGRAESTISQAQRRLKLKPSRTYRNDPPAWLPPELAPTYRAKVYDRGQFEAAAWGRREKRKMEARA